MHISELANHHVESPGEVASPGDEVRVKILEIDEERRRISLSIKRVEGQGLPLRDVQVPEPVPPADGPAEAVPDLALSEEVFSESPPEVARADGEEAPAAGEEAAGDPEQASGEGAETPGEGSRDDD